jgi:branched-chain amino acid transport system ATP-binding protein
MASVLRVDDLAAGYGEAVVLDGVSFRAREGEVTCILGPNGVGKTTLLRTVMGLVAPRRGGVLLRGEPIHGLATHEIVRRGMTMIPEGRRLWPSLTVRENLEMGAYAAPRERTKERLDEVLRIFPHLASRQERLCANLSGGEQQMVAIGRGLMGAPRLLLMDEPSLGLAPLVVREMLEVIRRIAAAGTTVLLVEQNTAAALEISRYGYVLETGAVALEGEAAVLRDDPHVKEAYLGLDGDERRSAT